MKDLWTLKPAFSMFDQGGGGGGEPPAGGGAPAGDPPKGYDWTADPVGVGKLDLGGAVLAGKYKSFADLEKGYLEASKMLGGKMEAFEPQIREKLDKELRESIGKEYALPEKYDWTGINVLEEGKGDLEAMFKDMGITQKTLPKAMEAMAGIHYDQQREILSWVWGVNGEPANPEAVKARLDTLKQQAINAGEDPTKYNSAADIFRLEAKLRAAQDKGTWKGEPDAAGRAGILARIEEVEKKLFTDKTLSSAEKKRLTEEKSALYAKAYPD